MPEFEERVRLSPATKALAARVDLDAFCASVGAAVADDVWAKYADNPTFRVAMEASVRDNVGSIVRLFSGQTTLDDTAPPAGFAMTDLLAEMGVPVGELERAYWVGVSSMWQEWFAFAEAAADRGEGKLAELVGPPTALMFEYLIEVLGLVVARYEAVSAAIRRTRDDRRRGLLAQLLDGSTDASAEEIEQVLGYRLTGSHVALAIGAPTRVEAEQLSTQLSRAVEAQSSLLLLHAPALWLLWLRFPPNRATSPVDHLQKAAVEARISVSIGDAGTDLAGFLQTRQDALETAGLRRWFNGGCEVLCFRDVQLEVLLMRDELRARRFVSDELGELNTDDERIDRIRTTLLDWLSTGSTSQTAGRLFVHENTIRTRLAQAEQLLHRDLNIRRAELMAALRLRAMLGHPHLTPSPEG